MDIRIETLGSLRIRVGDGESSSLRERPVRAALLLLLGLEREITRDRLIGFLWPDQAPDRARHTLSQTLYRLRRDLGEDWVVSEGEHLRVTDQVQVDALEFMAGAEGEDPSSALALYRGPFLEGWGFSVTNELEQWADQQRLKLSRLHRQVCREHLAALKSAGSKASALKVARHWAEVDPLEDEAQHEVIELLAESGNRTEALERYEVYRELLAADDLEPLDQTKLLIQRIRRDQLGIRMEPADPPASDPPTGVPDPSAILPTHVAPPTRRKRFNLQRVALTAALMLAVGLGGWWLLGTLAPGPILSPDVVPNRVLVLPLENRTDQGELAFVGGLAADWITRGLSDLDYLDVRPASEFMAAEAGAPASDGSGGTLGGSEATEIALRMGAGILVSGTYYAWGPGLEFHVQILQLPGGEILEAIGPVRSETLDPMEAVDIIRQRVAVALAFQMDENLTSLSASTLPPTLEAYQAYSSGARKFVSGDRAEAVAELEEAYHRSPDFTAPLVYAAFGRLGMGDPRGADSLAQILVANRNNLPRYDLYRLELLQARLRGDNAEAYRAVKLAAEVLEGGSAHYMTGQMALELNRPKEALENLESFDMTREWAQAWAPYWNVVTSANHLLEHYERELELAREGYRLNPDRMLMVAWLVRALAGQGRWEEIQPLLARTGSIRGPDRMTAGTVMLMGAQELRRHGHDEEALECLERAQEWAASRPADDPRSGWLESFRPRLLYQKGALQQKLGAAEATSTLRRALQEFETLAEREPLNLVLLGHLGATYARLGEISRAREMAESLRDLNRPYLLGQHTCWRARIASLLGEREEAVRLLWQAVGEGVPFGSPMHADPDLEPLHDFPPFQEFIRPKG